MTSNKNGFSCISTAWHSVLSRLWCSFELNHFRREYCADVGVRNAIDSHQWKEPQFSSINATNKSKCMVFECLALYSINSAPKNVVRFVWQRPSSGDGNFSISQWLKFYRSYMSLCCLEAFVEFAKQILPQCTSRWTFFPHSTMSKGGEKPSIEFKVVGSVFRRGIKWPIKLYDRIKCYRRTSLHRGSLSRRSRLVS